MTLKCTVDGRFEAPDHRISVCHHCGRPVCEHHGWVVSADDAFDDTTEELSRRVPQPAMHCKQCVDANHPRAYKHPGWTDPKEVQRAAQAARAAQPATAWQPVPQQGQAWGQPGQQQQWQGPLGGQQSGQQLDGRATGRP